MPEAGLTDTPLAMDDATLLREYAANGSETAFRTLVERHISLVYFAALRRLGNPVLAEDVTQVVFILLAKKARRLSKKTVLSGWLYRTTRFAAEKALRAESRRHWREREAVERQTPDDDAVWNRLAPVLGEAMAQLGEPDRTVVLLRFFENQSLKEIGRLLGISEDAAQKRISRAIIKLRNLLRNQGVSVPAAEVTAVISTQAVPAAPAHLIIVATQGVLGQTTRSATIHWLLQQTSYKLSLPRMAAVAGSALLLVTASVVFLHHTIQNARRNQLTHGTPGTANIVVRVTARPFPIRAPGTNIRFNLQGTPGLKYDMTFAQDTQTQQMSGVLPAEVTFQADAFTASLNVHGPGVFSFEVYRGNYLMVNGSPATITNAVRNYLIRNLGGGQGGSFSEKNIPMK